MLGMKEEESAAYWRDRVSIRAVLSPAAHSRRHSHSASCHPWSLPGDQCLPHPDLPFTHPCLHCITHSDLNNLFGNSWHTLDSRWVRGRQEGNAPGLQSEVTLPATWQPPPPIPGLLVLGPAGFRPLPQAWSLTLCLHLPWWILTLLLLPSSSILVLPSSVPRLQGWASGTAPACQTCSLVLACGLAN